MIKTGIFHGLFGFSKGETTLVFYSMNSVRVLFEDAQYRTVEGIRGHIHLALKDDGLFGPASNNINDMRAYTYFSRPWDDKTKGEVPIKTRQAIVDNAIENINKMRKADDFKKNLISAQRLRLLAELERAQHVVAEAQKALQEAQETAKAAEQAHFDWIMKHYPNDPEVVRA